jgi:hypothetical protein
MDTTSPEGGQRPWWRIPVALALLLITGVFAYFSLSSGTTGAGAPIEPSLHMSSAGGSAGISNVAAQARQQEEKVYPNGAVVAQEVHHDVSPPLRDIPPAPVRPRQERPDLQPPVKYGPHVDDPVVQRFFGPLVMPTPILTFEGISAATSGCGCYPPDTNGDVGPNHYIQTVNEAFEIWDKSGTVVQSARNITTIFTGFTGLCATAGAGDPVVLYDPLADRWLVSQLAFISYPGPGPYDECVAVSTSPDPTGTWNRYEFTISQTLLDDYPKLGVWPDAYYMTVNQFDQTGNFNSPALIAFDRTRMLAGQSATMQQFNPGAYYASILPADLDGLTPPPAGAPEPFVSVVGNNTVLHLWQLHIDWVNPASSVLTGAINLPAAPWDPNLCGGGLCIPQPGTAQRLDTLGSPTMFRLGYRRFADHESLVTNQHVDENGLDHAGVRWYEIRDPNGSPAIYQQGTYAPDADHRWMGSIAMDRDGNIAVGYSVSSSSTYPSIRYAGRLASDPPGQLAQGEASLFAGTGSQTGSAGRWGDYSDMTIDPSDDCTFWYTNEYLATTSGANWQTRIGKFKFPTCGQGPTPTVNPATPTPLPSATNTPVPAPTECANYTITTSTGTITPGTTDVGNHCDDCSTSITLPFPVRLYDQTFTSAYVSSNGMLEFASSDFAFGNACLPVPIFGYTVIGYWDDLDTRTTCSGCGIYTVVSGSAPNRVFNVEWRAHVLATGQSINFEMQFMENSNGGFTIVYGTSIGQGGLSATVGVEKNMSASTQYTCNTANITPGLMLIFGSPPCLTPTTVPATNTPTQPPVPSATNTQPPSVSSPTRTATNTNTPRPTDTAGPSPTPCTIVFVDVLPTDYFYTPVLYLACHGVISGYADHTFRPYNNTTRSQMVKIVVLGFNVPISTPTPTGAHTFADVLPDNTFFSFVETAASHNIVSGYTCGGPGEPCDPNNRPYFRPFANVTRGQLSKIDVVAAGWPLVNPPAPGTFEDVPPSNVFYTYIETAVCHGIISGYECGGAGEPCDPTNRPYFRWYNDAIRGQIAKIVYLSITSTTSCAAR